MAYKYEVELRQKAERYVAALQQQGIEAHIVPNSFRDYQVKVSVSRKGRRFGNANLYYSPKKELFSLKTHELKNASIVSDLMQCWAVLDAPQSSGNAAPSPPKDTDLGIHIYVDGSYIEEAIGYAFVALQNGRLIKEQCGDVQEEILQGMHQVGGELKAVLKAVAWCQDEGIKDAAIFYDYEGIEKWATGQWRANKPATQMYAREASQWPVRIEWKKVASHTGNRWNEYADRLAKQGALQQQQTSNHDPIEEVQNKAQQFITVLHKRGIAANYMGVFNNQYARIECNQKPGVMDIYNTKKRPLTKPWLHGFLDPDLQLQINKIWADFLSGDDIQAVSTDTLAEVTYYYQILEPYRHLDFDFFALAKALQRAYQALSKPYPTNETIRYDFPTLHEMYISLQQEIV